MLCRRNVARTPVAAMCASVARPLFGGRVLADEGEHRVVLRAEERGVDDALHASRHRGVHGVEVLAEPVLGLGGGHEVEGVDAGQRGGQTRRIRVATRVGHHFGSCDLRGLAPVADDQLEPDVVGVGQALDDASTECSCGACDGDHPAHATPAPSCGIMTPTNTIAATNVPGGTPCASAS
jgi:hypothetical protein